MKGREGPSPPTIIELIPVGMLRLGQSPTKRLVSSTACKVALRIAFQLFQSQVFTPPHLTFDT
jgi:hypothetical protein